MKFSSCLHWLQVDAENVTVLIPTCEVLTIHNFVKTKLFRMEPDVACCLCINWRFADIINESNSSGLSTNNTLDVRHYLSWRIRVTLKGWRSIVLPDGNDCCWYKISRVFMWSFEGVCIVSNLFSLDLLIALIRNKTNISWTMHPTLDNFVFYFWYWNVSTQQNRRLILATKWVFATSQFWWMLLMNWWKRKWYSMGIHILVEWFILCVPPFPPHFLTLSRRPYSYSNNLIRFHWMLFSTKCRHRRQGVCDVRRSIVDRALFFGSVNHSSAFRTRHFCFFYFVRVFAWCGCLYLIVEHASLVFGFHFHVSHIDWTCDNVEIGDELISMCHTSVISQWNKSQSVDIQHGFALWNFALLPGTCQFHRTSNHFDSTLTNNRRRISLLHVTGYSVVESLAIDTKVTAERQWIFVPSTADVTAKDK